jgi:hypothetical protein
MTSLVPHIAEMDQDKPSSYKIRDVVQEICIHHTVKDCVTAENEKEDRSDTFAIAILARNHLITCDSLDKEDERRDG